MHTLAVADPDGDFKPNVVNTVVWLVTGCSTLVNFAVNYAGRTMAPNV